MHDSFEKEVQKKMEELNLKPTPPVWERIELEIRPEKRKRRVLIWFFLAALLLGGGIFSYQSFNDARPAVTASQEPLPINSSSTESHPANTDSIKKQVEPTAPAVVFPADKTADVPAMPEPKTSEEKLAEKSLISSLPKAISKTKKQITKTENKIKSTIQKVRNPEITSNQIASTPGEFQQGISSGTDKTSTTTGTPHVVTTDTMNIVKQAIQDTTQNNNPEKIKPAVADSSLKKKAAQLKKWQRKIFFAAGISNQVSGIDAVKATMDAGIPQNSGGLGSGGGAAFAARPEEVSPGFGGMIGYQLAKKISGHIEFSVGIHYGYYSVKQRVGDNRRNDTALRYGAGTVTANQFYTNAGQRQYTSHFHTLQVPVTVHYQPTLKWPLYIAAGLSYGQIISTNLLTYSSSSNVYYRNKENDVRSLLPLHASLQVGLFEKTKTAIRIGPMLQYNLLKSQKEISSGPAHLFFAGLQSTINF